MGATRWLRWYSIVTRVLAARFSPTCGQFFHVVDSLCQPSSSKSHERTPEYLELTYYSVHVLKSASDKVRCDTEQILQDQDSRPGSVITAVKQVSVHRARDRSRFRKLDLRRNIMAVNFFRSLLFSGVVVTWINESCGCVGNHFHSKWSLCSWWLSRCSGAPVPSVLTWLTGRSRC